MDYILDFIQMHLWTIIIIAAIFLIIMTFSLWRIFEKAKVDGYKALIPIYNIYIWIDIAELPIFLIPALFIPILNILIFYLVSFKLGSLFGKNLFFKLGMCILPFIFYPILGLSKSLYKAEEERGYINPKDSNTMMYNQFPDVLVEEVIGNNTLISSISSSVQVEETPIIDNNLELETSSNKEFNNDEVLILDIDNEDETWNNEKKLTETEQTLKVVSVDPLKDDPLFNPDAKPVKLASLDKYKICNKCGTRLDADAKICFLCGAQIENSTE